MSDNAVSRGAYGLRLEGLALDQPLIPIQKHLSWPTVKVRHVIDITSRPSDGIDEAFAAVEMVDGDRALIDRLARTATYVSASERLDGRILHPFLTAVGASFAWWNRHEAFHGGGFVAAGGAWGVLGPGQAGKSSLLAALSKAGRSIVSDDLLVVSDRGAFSGPRCIDLRAGVATMLRLESRTELVRGGQRFRVSQAAVEPENRLCGWIFPTWGASLQLRPLRPRERLARLSAQRCVPSHPGSPILVDLVALPAWELVRPRDWTSLDATVDALIALTDT